MRAIILAGGPARKEAGLPKGLPRPLWPVLMRPIVLALIQRLMRGGVTSITVCANGRTEIYADWLGQEHRQLAELRFSEDPLPRGPAGCVKDNEEFLADEPFVIANAACWLSDSVTWLFEQHRRRGNRLTVFCRPDTWGPSGVYICEPSVLQHIPEVGYYDIKEQLISRLLKRGCRVGAVGLRGPTSEVVNARSYLATHHRALAGATGSADEGWLGSYRQPVPGVWVAEDAFIAERARLFGPVVVGSKARIENDAVLIGPTTVGPGAEVGGNAVVTGSAVWANARIPPESSFDHAVVMAVDDAAQRGATPGQRTGEGGSAADGGQTASHG